MRIGIFGGTFDPPHLGHMILAAEAWDQLQLDRLLFVLTPDPPHKQDQLITSLEFRLQMLEATVIDNPVFEHSRVEIDRSGPHYAVDTVHLLQEEYPEAELIYLMGGDSLIDLPKWHRPQAFLSACTQIGVMDRPQAGFEIDALEGKLPGVREKIRFINAPLLEISSRQIRRRVREGRPYRYYLMSQVTQIIDVNNLYRDPIEK